MPIDHDHSKDEHKELIPYKKMTSKSFPTRLQKVLRFVKRMLAYVFGKRPKKTRGTKEAELLKADEDESLDWWSKYFVSLEVCELRRNGTGQPRFISYT